MQEELYLVPVEIVKLRVHREDGGQKQCRRINGQVWEGALSA